MGLASAFRDNKLRFIPVALLATMGWLLIGLFSVTASINESEGIVGGYIGHAPASGYAGLAVILTTLLVALYLYASTGEAEPTPERFPPR